MNRLMIANSEIDQDMYYATGFLAPDPFIFVQKGSKKLIVVSELEYGRAKKTAKKGVKVMLSDEFEPESFIDLVVKVLKHMKLTTAMVPPSFPLGYAEQLKRKVKLKVRSPFYPERVIKTKQEIAFITKAQRATEKSMRAARDLLATSKIKGNFLVHKGNKLTSEDVKYVIRSTLSKYGVLDDGTIVACGAQSVLPHDSGSGYLRPHKPIIVDIFPRHEGNRYFADMTRTFCKGKPSQKLLDQFALVKKAQKAGLDAVREGVTGAYVHKKVEEVFGDMNEYFIHGTGHAVGLEIHEPPRLSPRGTKLKAGMVVTVEPGLYVPGVGGIRLEDLVVVTKKGCINLTKFEKKLIVL